MRLIKPLWLNHSGEKRDLEVYSCSVSSDGKRLVTAAGDGYVRIWSTEAIYRGTDLSFDGPKQLAALSYHSGTIHTVRFSPNNRFLASGADDRFACVYWLDHNAPARTTFGSNEAPPVENWRIHRRLSGHDNDVQDLGWAPDSSILVTVGLDSKVVIWSGHTFEKLKTISAHSSQVKGITFDPANKFFATASDDRSVKIFSYYSPEKTATALDQTNNFVLEHSITAPFNNSPLSTYFRRPSWSPDGSLLVAANAVNGPVATAVVIYREPADEENHFVGHEGPVEVCSFSPRIFEDPEKDPDRIVTVVACAGQDRNLSVWCTTNSKPVVITENLTLKSISDIAWAPDGERLFFTSLDGTIALADFSNGELGTPLPLDANLHWLEKYGTAGKIAMVEGPDGHILEEQSKMMEQKAVQGRMGQLMGDGPSTSTTGFSSIGGTKTAAQTNGVTNGDSGKTADDIEKPLTNGHSTAEPVSATEDPRVERLKSRVTITKDGKKRVAPILVSDAAGQTQGNLPQTAPQAFAAQQQTDRSDAPQHILDLSKPYDGFPKGGLTSLLLGNKRKMADMGDDETNPTTRRLNAALQDGTTPILMNSTEGLTAPSDAVTRPSDVASNLSVSQIRLALPTIRANVHRRLHPVIEGATTTTEDQSTVMNVQNATGANRLGNNQVREPTRMTVTKRNQLLWQDYLPKAISIVTANSRFWAAACEDGSLHIWSPAGRRLFNPFILESQIAILDCRGPWLLAVSATGMCHVWNVERSSSPHPPVSIGPVLEIAAQFQGPHLGQGPGIVFARLNAEGRIILAMSNGDCFAYSQSMFIWQRLSEAWWAVGSQYWNSSDAVLSTSGRVGDPEEGDMVKGENNSAGVIPLLERNTNTQTQLRGRAYTLQRLIKVLFSAEGYEGLESSVSVAHLENRVAAALTLGAREEFKIYLMMYTKRLGQENARLKIEELLRSLVRGMSGGGKNERPFPGRGSDVEAGEEELCGWRREVLLREIVLILGKYRDLQRITVTYARLLGMTDEDATKEGALGDQVMNGV